MRLRTFTVPFARIVGTDATELEFGPEDFIVVRPLFGLSRDAIVHWGERISDVQKAAEASDPGAGELADRLVLDMLRSAVIEWHLDGPDGPVPMPGTPEALGALPGGLAGALYGFLSTYRGEGPNPTTRQ